MNETAFPTPSSDRTEIVSSAPDAIPPAEPVGMPDQPPRTHEVSASFGGGIDYLGSVAVDSNIPASVPRRAAGIEQPPQPWLSSGVQFQDTPLPLRPSDVKATPTVMDGERPPTVPPSGGEIPGASPPNPTGLVGAEAKSAAGTYALNVSVGLQGAEVQTGAGAKVNIPATAGVAEKVTNAPQDLSSEIAAPAGPLPHRAEISGSGASSGTGSAAGVGSAIAAVTGNVQASIDPVTLSAAATTGPTSQRSRSRIETDCTELLFLAISLEKLAREEITRLANQRPNEPGTIESNGRLSDVLAILADGFAKIAAALEEYRKNPQPLLAGKAKRIVEKVGAQLEAWWDANAAEATDWSIRVPMFTAFIGALGLAGADMHFATAAVGVVVGGPKVATMINAVRRSTKQL